MQTSLKIFKCIQTSLLLLVQCFLMQPLKYFRNVSTLTYLKLYQCTNYFNIPHREKSEQTIFVSRVYFNSYIWATKQNSNQLGNKMLKLNLSLVIIRANLNHMIFLLVYALAKNKKIWRKIYAENYHLWGYLYTPSCICYNMSMHVTYNTVMFSCTIIMSEYYIAKHRGID